MIVQLQNMLGPLKPYSLYIAAGIFLGLVLLVWLWRNSRVSAQQSQQYMTALLQDIASANNRLVALEKKIHLFRQQSLQYTGDTKERIDSIDEEMSQYRQNLKQLKQSLTQCEQTLQTSHDVQESDQKIQDVLQQLEELEPALEEIQEFYSQLHELEIEVRARIKGAKTKLDNEIATSLKNPKVQLSNNPRIDTLCDKLSQAEQSYADFDPIATFSLLDEWDDAFNNPSIPSVSPPKQETVAPPTYIETETAEPEAIPATESADTQSFLENDYFRHLLEAEVEINLNETAIVHPKSEEADPEATLENDDVLATDDDNAQQFVLADSWLQDFNPNVQESTRPAPEITAQEDRAEQAKAQLLAEAQSLFEVSATWLEPTTPMGTMEIDTVGLLAETEVQPESDMFLEDIWSSPVETSDMMSVSLTETLIMSPTPVSSVAKEPPAPTRRKKIIVHKKSKESVALHSIRSSLQAAGYSLAQTPAQPMLSPEQLDQQADALRHQLLSIKQGQFTRLQASLSQSDEGIERLKQLEKLLHEAVLLLKQKHLAQKNPKRFQVNLERVEHLFKQFAEISAQPLVRHMASK